MEKECRVCKKLFWVKPSQEKIRFTCSKRCGIEYQKISQYGSSNPNFRNLPAKVCLNCNNEFSSYDKKRRYCSLSCAGRSESNIIKLNEITKRPRRPAKRIRKTCMIKYGECLKCKSSFVLPAKKKRKYCHSCYQYGNTKRVCMVCSKGFKAYNKKNTCSKKCLSLVKSDMQRGEKSHRWKGGKTSQALIIRGSFEYKQWRSKVFERDNYTCQVCGQRGGKLNADHIKSFALFPELRLDIDNGRTLCFNCHTKTPNFARKAVYQRR